MSENAIAAIRHVKILQDSHLIYAKIIILCPVEFDEYSHSCEVIFENYELLNCKISGIDGVNALECAIKYINAICNNPSNPSFFWMNGDSMKISNSEIEE